MRLQARRLLSLFVALASSAAWGQQIQVAPIVAPIVPVPAVAAVAAPITGPATLAGAGLALAPSVSGLPAPAVSIASLAQARIFSPASVAAPAAVATPVSVAGGVASAAGPRGISVAARAAALRQEGSSLSSIAELGSQLQGTGRGERRSRSDRLSEFYDRSRRSAPAQPVAPSARPAAPAAPRIAEGTAGRALLDAVHALASRGHNGKGYDEARAYMYGTADHVRRGNQEGILEVYTQTFVPGKSSNGGDYHGGHNGGDSDRQGINAEHIWPQSFFSKKLPMRSDLHNLVPTFVHPNSLRGHLPFGEVTGRPEYSNRAGAKLGGGVFEPPPAAKGRIARSILYFVARYLDGAVKQGDYSENFFNRRLEMFLRWNREHPPTDEERSRNDLVAKFQGNRNPFVDDPALADRIGVEGFRFDANRSGRVARPGSHVAPHYNEDVLISTARMTLFRDTRGTRGTRDTRSGGSSGGANRLLSPTSMRRP